MPDPLVPSRPTTADVLETLRAEANPADAAVLARYFRTEPGGYGEGDVFIGIKLSRLRAILKPHLSTPFAPPDWLPLLNSSIHEHRLACLVVMAGRARRGRSDEQELIYETYLGNTGQVNNWDLVDVSCAPIVGGYLLERDRAPLYRLVGSRLIWERRIAIVSTHWFIRAGQSADTYALATRLLDDEHDLIHKATGWMLREAGKRVDRDELIAFLDEYAATMPRTMLRYAIEHFEADQRTDYLGRRHLAR